MAQQITKRALAQALRHCMAQKPLKKITISDLTEYCGVSRMTFYYHFEDIYDLATWCCKENLKKALEGETPQSPWQEGLRNIFQVTLADREFALSIYQAFGRDQSRQYATPYIQQIIARVIDEEPLSASVSISPADRQFVVNCYNHVFVNVFLDWVQSGMAEDPDVIVDRLSILLRGSFPQALARFSNRPSSS